MTMNRIKGFTLVEILVSVSIFLVVVVSVYQSYAALSTTIRLSRIKLLASDLVNEQFEVIRNLPYVEVGVTGSIPTGKLLHIQNILRGGVEFIVVTTVRNTDDPFDGTIDNVPQDLSPADYKLVEVEVTCPLCSGFNPVLVTSIVAPRNLETASTNGALFVRVFDANGLPVSNADVHIVNASSSLVIDDVTPNSGLLQIVDAPPGVNVYEITVSKPGYSSDRTYPLGAPGNPNPSKPHATVALQSVTQVSFAIDKTSTLDISTLANNCTPVSNASLTLTGAKLIGNPSVYKYNHSFSTDGSGHLTLENLEWDDYSLIISSGSWEIRGLSSFLPIQALPNTAKNLQVILGPKSPNTVLISVVDSATGLPISNAIVTMGNSTLYTSRSAITQSDWSGGGGQSTSTDPTKFESYSNIAINSPVGDIKLADVLGTYSSIGSLVSSAFDVGALASFQKIEWNPTSQSPSVGIDSVKFQFASNNTGGSWNFVGPDNTSNSYYTLSDQDLSPLHTNARYAKYKIFLSTATADATPSVSDITFTFTSGCMPPGQVTFSNLSLGNYPVTVSKTGYQAYSGNINVNSDWQNVNISLTPE